MRHAALPSRQNPTSTNHTDQPHPPDRPRDTTPSRYRDVTEQPSTLRTDLGFLFPNTPRPDPRGDDFFFFLDQNACGADFFCSPLLTATFRFEGTELEHFGPLILVELNLTSIPQTTH